MAKKDSDHKMPKDMPKAPMHSPKDMKKGMGKGGGKTPIAACIGAFELAGDVHISPRVIIGAASLKQANWVFGDLRTCVSESPTLRPLVEPYDLQILLRDRPGVAERIAAEAGTNDGARCTCFIADEAHEWTEGRKRVYLIVDGAVAKRRDAFTLAITTAGVKGKESPAEDLYNYGVKVASGLVVDDAFLFEWYAAPEGLELDDSEQWLAAVMAANPAAGDFLDLDNIRHRFETIPRHEFERYHLNRWVSSTSNFVSLDDWDACAGEVDIEPGDRAVVAVDGAAKRDTTAVDLIVPKDGKLHVRAQVFEPPDDGGVIDPTMPEEYIRELCRTYDVTTIPFDPALFFRSAQLLLEEGLPLEEWPQTHTRMIPASQALFDAIRERRIVHDGDPVLRAHIAACVARETGRGWRLDKDRAADHIDAAVALAMAIQAALEDEAAPQPGVLFIDV